MIFEKFGSTELQICLLKLRRCFTELDYARPKLSGVSMELESGSADVRNGFVVAQSVSEVFQFCSMAFPLYSMELSRVCTELSGISAEGHVGLAGIQIGFELLPSVFKELQFCSTGLTRARIEHSGF